MKKYMHVDTGSVDTEENWFCEITQEEMENKHMTKEQVFENYIHDKILCEVEKDENGEWIEVK